MSDDALHRCEEAIGYRFRDPALLRAALTHASVAPNRLESNERLEFLGDAILGMVVCQYLYDHYPDYLEGSLTKIKSAVVARKTCAEIADALGISKCLYLGNGISGRAKLPTSLPAGVFESLIAALAIDGGPDLVRSFILRHMVPHIEQAVASDYQHNHKSQLQQYAQKMLGATPVYEFLDEKGPDHSKCFEVAVCIGDQRFPSAWGPNKKEAEQKAAYNALVELNLVQAASETPAPTS